MIKKKVIRMTASVFQPPKGMKDIEPEEMARRKWVYGIIRKVLDSYGYIEVEPVAVEMFETLSAKSGDDVKNEIYFFRDKGGRELGLRFELTAGMARMVASRDYSQPIKMYSIGSVWRYDNPQMGRFRCFTQWDLEVFGPEGVEADAEILAVNAEIFSDFGLKNYEFRINSRNLIKGILEYVGVQPDQMDGAMRTIDKLAKLSRQELYSEFQNYGIEKIQAEEILNALSRKGKPAEILKGVKKDFPKNDLVEQGISELEKLFEVLGGYGILDKCILDLSIVRGLAYYTGIVFETYDKKNEDVGSFLSGGRFDKLAGIYGKEMAATGIAGGLERFMIVLEKNGLMPNVSSAPEYYVAAVGDGVRGEALRIAKSLRLEGRSAECDIMGRALSKQMKYVDKRGISKVVFVGEKEMKSGELTVRDMKTGKETKMKVKEL